MKDDASVGYSEVVMIDLLIRSLLEIGCCIQKNYYSTKILILFKLFSSVNDFVDASDASMSFQDEEQFLISGFDTIVVLENWNFCANT